MIRSSGSSWSRRKTSSREPDDGGFETMRPSQDDDEFETCASDSFDDEVGDVQQAKAPGLSLKARAVAYLSRREYARTELARKLQPYADSASDISSLLDDLEKEGWLSTERFAQSLVNRRAGRQGTARIVQELRQHGVADEQVAELRETLHATEYQRAFDVWRKRFSSKPLDRKEYAKQARFLASRGFAHDSIRRILGGEHDDD
jgi:regulatory protein